jgi:phosphopantothenoylcysteine decarboxylase/phosphopantothenate--cysteine ligase
LNGKKILITAGPTREHIDPVRYIGNQSSGKMGYALAESCAARGADVILVSGPVEVHTDNPQIRLISVVSAEEMYDICMNLFKECDAAIMSAAVSDFTPVTSAPGKLKRTKNKISLELVPTKDIAASLGQMKSEKQVLAGFALESENEIKNALKKIVKKNLDFIVLNSLRDEGAGFGTDTNKITIIDKHNNIQEFELKPKKEVAEDIVDELETYFIKRKV